MDLFALLIGINDYPSRPLTQCVNDVGKFEKYLLSQSQFFTKTQITKLLNKEATRDKVIEHISNILQNAKDDDVALIYYSGHGALQESGGHFPEEHDGLLECMVCYADGPITSDQLLSDKELRYLLYKLKSKPHLVTIFDACHSGDMVRGLPRDEDDDGMIKRITGVFEARNVDSFLFKSDHEVEKSPKGNILQFEIPFKNHVHIAACLSSESSWEDREGGVFTRYLLKLLEATQGNLNYLDIARWAKISLKNITKKNQTPVITVQGEGAISAHSSWLNLHPKGVSFPQGL
ncbi:MAG TPA: caspase family protein, partial [Saprospiraceae bacterium]|nr:caspase family protein [Saprospiraceae bacterium]